MSLSNLESFLRSFQADTHLREFQDPVRDDLEKVQGLIRDFFESPIGLLQGISDHLLGVTGKKFRPTILLLVSRLGRPDPETAVFGAAMIELIHTATLVHDDTIDRSDMRRGRPTINALYNDTVSTILGDYIYTKVFHELFERDLLDLVRITSRCAYRMSVGEMLQLEQKNDPSLSEEQYLRLVDEKTASLMGASSEMGAALGGMDPERKERFRMFGEMLGRAYQITDDLFDYVGSEDEMGKGVRSDLAEGKITLPLIRALARARGEKRRRLRQLVEARHLNAVEWSELIEILEETGALDYCRERALSNADQALGHLSGEPEGPCRRGLELAVAYAVHRSH